VVGRRPPAAGATPPLERILAPFREFFGAEVAGGIVLLAATLVALGWANSPWVASYGALWQTPLAVGTEAVGLRKPLQLWINDGLMAIFFFVVGLEIKREVLHGELASPRRALLPVLAALGGAVFPALIYLAFNLGTDAARGWGIAMATDIAFALGLLAILGSRVPTALKVFVTALAIVDDILAVLVIGLFYTANLDLRWLAVAAAALGLLGLANRLGVARLDVYAVLAVGLWLAVLQSGIHATLAGVMAAMTIPARAQRTPDEALATVAAVLPRPGWDAAAPAPAGDPDPEEALRRVRAAAEAAEAPLERLEHALHPWTAFAIVPLFALANAGVTVGDHLAATVASPVAYGIVAGLVVGKQVGILSATWLAVRSGLASLPSGVSWLHVWGGSWAAGIGFTMSLFIAELAFPGQVRLEVAKLGILAASVTAATGGAVVLGLGGRRRRTGGPS